MHRKPTVFGLQKFAQLHVAGIKMFQKEKQIKWREKLTLLLPSEALLLAFDNYITKTGDMFHCQLETRPLNG